MKAIHAKLWHLNLCSECERDDCGRFEPIELLQDLYSKGGHTLYTQRLRRESKRERKRESCMLGADTHV